MEPNWASENLQVIRTLMERAALYRRALAPVMIWAGCVGTAAAVIGTFDFEVTEHFALYWVIVGFVASLGSILLIRRQALKDSEPVWSPPTRRVVQAAFPAFFVGGVFALIFIFHVGDDGSQSILPPLWMTLYGCALNAAGFFMQRGIRLFGWAFLLAGAAVMLLMAATGSEFGISPHLLMGLTFGGFHLAYGIYLYFTEKRKNVP